MTTCAACGKPVPDQGVICHDETDLLASDLRKLAGWTDHARRHHPGLLADLLVTGSHTDVIGSRPTAADDDTHRTLDGRYPAVISEAGSPANFGALALHHAIRNALTTWARLLLSESGYPCDHHSCRIGATPACRRWDHYRRADTNPGGWLLANTASIRRRDWAPDMLRQVSGENGLTVRALRMVDRAPGAFRIPCPACGERVPIDPDESIIRCTCGEYGTVRWWVERVAPSAPEPMRLSALPPWLLLRGYLVSVDQLRQWADRDRITPTQAEGPGIARLFDPAAVLIVVAATRSVRRVPAVMTA